MFENVRFLPLLSIFKMIPKTYTRFILFVLLMWILVTCIVFTGINSVVFTSVFLPYYYPNDYSLFDFINSDMVISYWDWIPGRIMIGVNVFFSFSMFFVDNTEIMSQIIRCSA